MTTTAERLPEKELHLLFIPSCVVIADVDHVMIFDRLWDRSLSGGLTGGDRFAHVFDHRSANRTHVSRSP